ncbi:MAG TPA: hypothetical protein VN697_07485, partial [Tepidiformaceae bacterium]|nr:hypothetical protein [Tepidiformaceae bacterium]
RARVLDAAIRAAGSVKEGDVPEWDTDEGVREWRRTLWSGSERTRQLEEWYRERELAEAPATPS